VDESLLFENENPELTINWMKSPYPNISFSGQIHKLHEMNIVLNLWSVSTENQDEEEEESYDETIDGILKPVNQPKIVDSRIRGNAYISLVKLVKIMEDENKGQKYKANNKNVKDNDHSENVNEFVNCEIKVLELRIWSKGVQIGVAKSEVRYFFYILKKY
jgi:hypothetical protein